MGHLGHLKTTSMIPKFYPNGEFSLGLSSPVKSHKTPPKPSEARERKGRPFTSHGRRYVRNAAWWLSQTFGKQRLSFLTCTLPDEALDLMAIADDAAGLWAEIIRQFEQWLKRRLRSHQLCEFIVGVTEVQDQRWFNDEKVGLHLHWVFQGRSGFKSPWAIKKEEFAKAWLRIVSNVIGQTIESRSATRVERIKKSIENYLSKYMSKGGKVIEEVIEAGKRNLLPTSWWNVSHDLRRIIKSMIRYGSDDAGNCLYDSRKALEEQKIIQWMYIHEIDLVQSHGEVMKVPVAFIGKFSKPEYIQQFIY
jgi:hypothetical protein